MVMKGVGAGESGGDEAWGREGDENGNGNGNQAAVREPTCRENGRRRLRRRRRGIPSRIFTGLHKQYAKYALPARHRRRRHHLPRASLGYPNFIASSSNSNAPEATTPQNGSRPPSSSWRLRKMARYSSSPWSLARAASNVPPPPPWATGAGASRFSFQTSTPPLMMMSLVITGDRVPGPDPCAGANKAPAVALPATSSSLGASSSASSSAWMLPPLPPGRRSRSGALVAVRGRSGAALMSPLGFSFRRSGGEQAGAREEEVMAEKNADEEDVELTLGNAETRKDRA